MAHRVSTGGTYRIDRVFPPPVGRLALASGCTTQRGLRDVNSCLSELARNGRLDVLAALKARTVSVPEVLHAARQRDSGAAFDALLVAQTTSPEAAPLWAAVDAWLGPVTERGETTERYGLSFNKLRRTRTVSERATVAALADVDWPALGKRWDGSAADWNHLRRAVSRFLTVHLDDTYHPLRRAVMKRFPKQREVERVPDLDVPLFWRIVEAAPEHVRPAFVALVALGLRVGEYLALRETDLHPITKTVSIPGTKTAGSAAVLGVADELWPWVVAAVPAPCCYDRLRRLWKRALEAVGADTGLRLHDLRHLTAQVLVNAGRSEASVQTTMRHATAAMTRRYAMQKDRGDNARALAVALQVPQLVPRSALSDKVGSR